MTAQAGDDLAPYHPGLATAWDRLVARAGAGTVLHSRRFLDYHGARFREESLVLPLGGTDLAAAFPLAADPREPGRVVSHPGTSFGGVLTRSRDPAQARAILRRAARQLSARGYARLLYRAAPSAVLDQPDDGLLPDLLRLGQVVQHDLWSVLNLDPAAERRRYWQSEIRRAERKGLRVQPARTGQDWADLHAVLVARLAGKYGKAPVHSLDELIDLNRRLGPASRGLVVRDGAGQALAGLWCLDYGKGTLHNQYNAATDQGLALGASSLAIATALEAALSEGFRRFSFGRSTNEDGFTENGALVRFKAGFGAGLASQFHIEVPLDRLEGLRR